MFTKQLIAILLSLMLVLSGCAFIGPDSNNVSLNLDFSARSGNDDNLLLAVMIVDENFGDLEFFQEMANGNYSFSKSISSSNGYTATKWEPDYEVLNASPYIPANLRSNFFIGIDYSQESIMLSLNGILAGKRRRAIVQYYYESDTTHTIGGVSRTIQQFGDSPNFTSSGSMDFFIYTLISEPFDIIPGESTSITFDYPEIPADVFYTHS